MNFKLTKTDSGFSVNVPNLGRTKMQRHNIERFASEGRFDSLRNYLNSFSMQYPKQKNVYYKPTVYIDRLKSEEIDRLAEKRTNSVRAQADEQYRLKSHKPMIASRFTDWIGVEIECFVPRSNLHNISELEALFVENKVKRTDIKRDSSINAPEDCFPVEITVLTRLQDPSNLRQVCSLLASVGAKVNKSCGLHVHLDARHLDSEQVKKIGVRFNKVLPVLLAMVPRSRRSNSYCKPSVSNLNGFRYHAVNLTAFNKYKTVEIRLHSSTTDFNKIFNWALICTAISKAEIKRYCSTINELTEFVRISEELVEYMTQRTALFNGESISQAYQDNDSTETVGA